MIAPDTVLSLLALLFLALLGGAVLILRRDGWTRQVVLMIALALIVVANIAIWVVPGNAGRTLVNEQQR